MNGRTSKRLLPLILVLTLCGCAHLTPGQQVLWALNVYQAQYDMYLEQVINPAISAEGKEMLKADPSLITDDLVNPELTNDQRKALRIKKQILIELKPLVIISAEYQRTGVLPPAEIQKKLTDLINRLVALAEED